MSHESPDPLASIRYDDFPENPSPGNLAVVNDKLYCWSGVIWIEVPE